MRNSEVVRKIWLNNERECLEKRKQAAPSDGAKRPQTRGHRWAVAWDGPPRTQWQSGVTAAPASCPERAAPRKPLFPPHWSWLLTTLERSGKQRCREAEVTELSLRQVTLDLCTLGALRRAARPPSGLARGSCHAVQGGGGLTPGALRRSEPWQRVSRAVRSLTPPDAAQALLCSVCVTKLTVPAKGLLLGARTPGTWTPGTCTSHAELALCPTRSATSATGLALCAFKTWLHSSVGNCDKYVQANEMPVEASSEFPSLTVHVILPLEGEFMC